MPVRLPSISQYIDTMESPQGLFSTLTKFDVERNAYGEVKSCSGNNAVIFKALIDKKPTLIKCYIKTPQYQKKIFNYMHRIESPLLAKTKLLEDEMYVYGDYGCGKFYNIVIGEWTQGLTLDMEIRMAAEANNRQQVAALANSFASLAIELLDQPWAHGDLKPDNIIVRSDNTMQMIDYDAMFIPPLINKTTNEIGTPMFQHPARDGAMFDKQIDDYSIAMIYVSLLLLVDDPQLYNIHNKTDNIIFNPVEILNGKSTLYNEIKSHDNSDLNYLMQALSSSSPRIDGLKERIETISYYFSNK